tara:strand:- start:3734 stop:4555 length:822 start_codon:yes stop_codon:yes gene_type:complete
MSLIMKIAGADFSAFGLPTLKQTVFGFPADGLVGLYLFEDGDVDTAHAGVFLDSSGHKNNASLFSDFAAPVNRSYGLEVTDAAGLIINTGLPQTSEFTIVGCYNLTMDTATEEGYPTLTGDTGNKIPASKAATGSNNPRLALNVDLTGSKLSNGVYSSAGVMINGSARASVPAGYGQSDQPAILALTVASDTVGIQTLSGYKFSAQDADILSGYAALDEEILIGLWKHGATSALSGRLYGFAIYERGLDDVEISEAMAAMNARVAARGVVVVS